MKIRTGPRRVPSPPGDPSKAGLAWRVLAGMMGHAPTPEQREQATADRGSRLAAMLRGQAPPDIWAAELHPMFVEAHDAALEAVLRAYDSGEAPEAVYGRVASLSALYRWAQMLNGAIRLGDGAVQRLAQRHAIQAAASEASIG